MEKLIITWFCLFQHRYYLSCSQPFANVCMRDNTGYHGDTALTAVHGLPAVSVQRRFILFSPVFV